MNKDGGRIARTAGLVVTTAMSSAAIQCTTWDTAARITATVLAIFIGAFCAAAASDFGGPET